MGTISALAALFITTFFLSFVLLREFYVFLSKLTIIDQAAFTENLRFMHDSNNISLNTFNRESTTFDTSTGKFNILIYFTCNLF